MGRKKQQPKQRANKPARAEPARLAPAVSSRRDARPYIYLALDQIFVIVYAYLLVAVIPNRHADAAVHLWSLPVLLQAMAIGMAARLVPRLRRIGWWIGVVAGSLLVLVTILLVIRVLVSAAFLSGVYGSFGKAAAMSALIGVALIIELVALVPVFQLKYLLTRAGRRAFAIPT